MPEFSIIIPVYNTEKYLDRCIKSVLGQTYASFELLLIDDGSNDQSYEICKRWEERDERIRVFHQENKGACAARNVGLMMAQGHYVQFVDSDDTITKDCLECIEKLIEQYKEPAVVEYKLNYIGLNGYSNIQGTILQEGLYEQSYLQEKFIPVMMQTEKNEEIYYNIFNVLRFIRRDVIEKNNIRFNEKIRRWEDWIFAMEVFLQANEMVVTNQALYNYYGHEGGGLGGRYDPKTYEYVVESYRVLEEIAGEKYDVFSNYAISQKISQIERCIREIYVNEKKKSREVIIMKILHDSFFISCIRKTKEKKGIIFLRPYVLKRHYKTAIIMLNLYVQFTDMKQYIRNRLSGFYHKYLKGDMK